MDKRNCPEELSKRTGFLVMDSMRLEHVSDPDWVYYTVFCQARNVCFLIKYPRDICDDPVYDLAEDLKAEMDRFCDLLQAKRGHEGWQTKLAVNPPED